MSRKRLIASLLDDRDEESPSIQFSSVAHFRRNRSIASIVNEETASSSRLSNNIRMMIIKVVNQLDNHPNLLNEMNKIQMMMIITLMMLSYFGDVQEGIQLVQKFLVVVVMAMMVMVMVMVMVMIQMKINLLN